LCDTRKIAEKQLTRCSKGNEMTLTVNMNTSVWI